MKGNNCSWPGCPLSVSPALFMCARHWYTLPTYIRDMIWEAYVPRQEVTKTPSSQYVDAARTAMDWIRKNFPDPSEVKPWYPRKAKEVPVKRFEVAEEKKDPQGSFNFGDD